MPVDIVIIAKVSVNHRVNILEVRGDMILISGYGRGIEIGSVCKREKRNWNILAKLISASAMCSAMIWMSKVALKNHKDLKRCIFHLLNTFC